MKDVFDTFRGKMTGILRQQHDQDLRQRAERIRTLKSMVEGLGLVLARPDTKVAARTLTAIRKQLMQDLRFAEKKLAERKRTGRHQLSTIRRDARRFMRA